MTTTRRRAIALIGVLAATASAGSPASAATIATGSQHSCAVKAGGTVACWGSNTDGQLGDATNAGSPTPVDVAGLTNAVEIAAGSSHTCALRTGGTVSCWGSGTLGALGDGKNLSSNTPVAVTGLSGVVALSASGFTTCGLTQSGEIFCWGQHLGAPNTGMPGAGYSPLRLGTVTGAKDVSVGDGEICAVSAANTDCWSYWTDLGNGAASAAPSPILLPASAAIQQTTGGFAYGCGLLASGQVSCHGYNGVGQLGNGTTGNLMGNNRMPRGQSLALGVTDARALVSSQVGSCVLLANGKVQCWGAIGSGSDAGRNDGSGVMATPAFIPGLDDVVGIAAGNIHTCAAERSGAALCWGNNFSGQLGDGTAVSSVCPKLVGGISVAASARDAVTPVRRGEPDITAPEPTPGTTPLPPAQATLPCDGPSRPPVPTTPMRTTAAPTTPTLRPSLATTFSPAPLGFKGSAVTLIAYSVPERWAGKCPKTTKVTVKAVGRSKSKTFRVTRTDAGACQITGLVALRGRLAAAPQVTVVFRPQGVPSFKRRILAS